MASDLELKAKEAFEDDNHDLPYDLLTQAIGLSPNNADLYADRAQVNIKVNNLTGMHFCYEKIKACVFLIPSCLFCVYHELSAWN